MKQNLCGYLLFLLFVSGFLFIDTNAQNAHYWSNQYGTRADLLGGIVIGSVKDLSSTYYNPGAVSFSSERSLIISTHAFDITYIKLDLPINGPNDYDFFRTRVAPVIFALRLTNPLKFTNSFVISYVEKEDDEKEFSLLNLPYSQYEDAPELIKNSFNETRVYHNVGEHWAGITWTYTYNNKLGLGFTFYGAYRNQEVQTRINLQFVDSTAVGLSVERRADYEITHFRLFGKLGVFYEEENYSIGLTMLLPSLPLFGWGELLYLDSKINIEKEDNRYSSITNVTQSDLNVRYTYPFSIGMGGSYKTGNTRLHFSLEWFNNIPNYKMIDANPFTHPETGEMIDPDVYATSRSVLNYGFGFEYRLEKDVDLYFAIRTDFSSKYKTNYSALNFSEYNKYYINTGSAFKAFDYYITLGISYGFGASSSPSLFSKLFPDPLNDNSEEEDKIDLHYNNLKFILGFSF